MPPPQQVFDWVKRAYPKPAVDPEWIEACYEWIESEFHFNPNTQLDQILSKLEVQLLESELSTSMRAGTGLPANVAKLDNMTLRGPPILVQIVSMTEIGSSAFSLQNIRQARIEQADLAGLAEEEDDGEEGPRIPKYPRGMLKLELNDGKTTMQAIEYRRLPELELGETPLGFKMQLKNVFIRRGIAFLEPGNVIMKYHLTEELQAVADMVFVRGLQIRMGKDPVEQGAVGGPQAPQPPQDPPAQNNRAIAAPPAPRALPPPEAAEELPPNPHPAATAPRAPPATLPEALTPSSSTLVGSTSSSMALARSKFFTQSDNAIPSSSKGKERAQDPDLDLRGVLHLSPHRASPILYPDSDEDMQDANLAADIAMHDDGSSDYDWGDMDEKELVATLDRTEKGIRGQSTGPASSSTVSGVSSVPARSIAVVATKTVTTVKTEQIARPGGRSSEPIYISDSDDKENVMKPPRKRRHIVVAEEDIIDVSD